MSQRITSAEEQVRTEAELAKRLIGASDRERQALYGDVYDDIYSMHLSRNASTLEFGASLRLLPFLVKLTRPADSVLEIGCGAGLMAVELARAGRDVTGIDVSKVILSKASARAGTVPGLRFERVRGVTLPFADEAFDSAYSIEVVEHLHERDAITHFKEVRRVLRPGGRYWFLTPTRLASVGASGRFGVSVDADADVHLKEWTYTELQSVLSGIGFSRVAVPFRAHRALYLPWMPLRLIARAERLRSRPLGRVLGLGLLSVVAIR